jgi:hypothetical protein
MERPPSCAPPFGGNTLQMADSSVSLCNPVWACPQFFDGAPVCLPAVIHHLAGRLFVAGKVSFKYFFAVRKSTGKATPY